MEGLIVSEKLKKEKVACCLNFKIAANRIRPRHNYLAEN